MSGMNRGFGRPDRGEVLIARRPTGTKEANMRQATGVFRQRFVQRYPAEIPAVDDRHATRCRQ